MSRPWIAFVLALYVVVIVLALRVEHQGDRIKRLERACIPTDTGGGVTQCRQPTMREAPPH